LAKDAAAGAVLVLAAASTVLFALVATRHAEEIAQGWRGLLPLALAALALAGLTALLPGSPRLGRRASRVLAALGVTLITFLAFVGEGRPGAVFTMGVFAVAVAAGNRRRRRHRE
jgi:diacylglycerol kinase (ATP)